MNKILNGMAIAAMVTFVPIPSAVAKQLTQDEVVKAMVNKSITTRSFGMKIRLRFRSNGVLTAKSIVGDYKGRWSRGSGNEICSTFPSGPAKGTQCNTYTKTGANSYRTSSGTSFVVN